MAIDYAAMKIEIALPAYNGMTDAQIAAAINAGTHQIAQDIPTDLAKMALIDTTNLDWGECVGVANGSITSTAAKRKRAITLVELLNTQSPLEVAQDAAYWGRIVALLAALVTDAILSTAGKTAFENLRVKIVPLWQKFGDRELDFNDIAIARNS